MGWSLNVLNLRSYTVPVSLEAVVARMGSTTAKSITIVIRVHSMRNQPTLKRRLMTTSF